MLQSVNPFNNQVIKNYEPYSHEEIETIISNSFSAFKKWRTKSFGERSSYLHKMSEILKNQVGKWANMITLEMGKPIKEAKAEIEKCAWVCSYYAENAASHLKTEYIKTEYAETRVQYEPIGTILGIMPWNFPYWQVFRYLAPTLMAGNTVLLKHASNVQGCALQIEEIIKQAGFPQDVFRVLVVGSDKIKTIIEHDAIKGITLTGSEYAGSQTASQAGLNIKKTVLELGGSNAFIVMDDANFNEAVKTGLTARFLNGGQSCIAAKRFIVHKKIYNEFIDKYENAVEKLVLGNPMNENTDIGPLSSEKQALEVENQVKKSIQMGARAVLSGNRRGAFYPPTILDNVNLNMPVMNEEVFGPVAPFITFQDDEEAIEIANKTRFGLGVTIFTSNKERAEKIIPLIEDGAVFVNELVKSDPRLPFGGTKKSGYGRELSLLGIREFVNAKTVFIK